MTWSISQCSCIAWVVELILWIGGEMLWWFRIITSLWELKTIFADSCWKRLDACNKIHYIYLVILWKTNIFFSQVFQAKQANVSIFCVSFAFFISNYSKTVFKKIKRILQREIVASRCWIQWAAHFAIDFFFQFFGLIGFDFVIIDLILSSILVHFEKNAILWELLIDFWLSKLHYSMNEGRRLDTIP